MWGNGSLQTAPEEGHIYALVAPRENGPRQRALLEEASLRLADLGARRLLLYPSWVCGTQSMYNGIAGAYEMPGLSDTRHELLAVAEAAGFAPVAEYGTPELSLTDPAGEVGRRGAREELWEVARRLGLQQEKRALRPTFFANRTAVTLVRGREIVAMTAYGPWEEYMRGYGRPLFGITSVQVEIGYRGRKLGKLVMLLALEAAREAGAEAVHLHVYRSNEPAWNLYHRALGFQPKYTYLTLAKDLV
jgi:ribosomal protein S18 acetylase RimI-like enzyme